jgi:hypothetical protein
MRGKRKVCGEQRRNPFYVRRSPFSDPRGSPGTYKDVRLSTLSKASTGRLLSPLFCRTKRFKFLKPEKASRSIVCNLLSDKILLASAGDENEKKRKENV